MFEAFQLGPFLFRSHSLFLLLGIWLSAELFIRLAQSEGMRMTLFLQKGVWFLIAFLVCGRLFGILLLYQVYIQDPLRMMIVWDGAFSVIGACMGVGIALFYFTRRDRDTFLAWLDVFVPSVTLLMAFDWFGRLLGMLSYGRPTDVFWGTTVSSMSVRYTVPIHPVQLYYALWFFALTILLLHVRKKNVSRIRTNMQSRGLVTLTGIGLGSLSVILFEFFRGDFAVAVFAKLTDFVFLAFLFISLGSIAALETRISHQRSLMLSIGVGILTMGYVLLRPWIPVISVEWRFSQFLAVLAMLSAVVYVVVHRWKHS